MTHTAPHTNNDKLHDFFQPCGRPKCNQPFITQKIFLDPQNLLGGETIHFFFFKLEFSTLGTWKHISKSIIPCHLFSLSRLHSSPNNACSLQAVYFSLPGDDYCETDTTPKSNLPVSCKNLDTKKKKKKGICLKTCNVVGLCFFKNMLNRKWIRHNSKTEVQLLVWGFFSLFLHIPRFWPQVTPSIVQNVSCCLPKNCA